MPGKHHLREFKIAKKSARRFAARGRCSASSLAQTPPWKKARSAPASPTVKQNTLSQLRSDVMVEWLCLTPLTIHAKKAWISSNFLSFQLLWTVLFALYTHYIVPLMIKSLIDNE